MLEKHKIPQVLLVENKIHYLLSCKFIMLNFCKQEVDIFDYHLLHSVINNRQTYHMHEGDVLTIGLSCSHLFYFSMKHPGGRVVNAPNFRS